MAKRAAKKTQQEPDAAVKVAGRTVNYEKVAAVTRVLQDALSRYVAQYAERNGGEGLLYYELIMAVHNHHKLAAYALAHQIAPSDPSARAALFREVKKTFDRGMELLIAVDEEAARRNIRKKILTVEEQPS